jgi:predicted nuclease of restriction endonuclease-like (RecB) superfamily
MKEFSDADRAAMKLYVDLLFDIKTRIRQAQVRAGMSANAEMIRLYWDIGRMVAERQQAEGWGKGLLRRLAADLKNDISEIKGFSERNIQLMIQFQAEYPDLFPIPQRAVAELPETASISKLQPPGGPDFPELIVQRTVAQLPWAHNVLLIQKVKDISTRLWYGRQAIEHGWSRDILSIRIKSNAHKRQGNAVTNFAKTLPPAHSELAVQLLKDPYLFDFLTLEEPFRERELETELIRHIEKFLLELGRGFAFVGRQYRLLVSNRDFYLDLLFYHLRLRCFVVVDIKKGDFKPEYAGKMNFYCSVVDDQLRHEHDRPTVGLILCQTKDRILAEYALRDIHKPIGVADYELTRALPEELASSLPTIEEIEAELAGSLEGEE